MLRSLKDLKESKDRLERLIALAQQELEALQGDIANLEGNAPLDEKFFWAHLVPILVAEPTGLSSLEIYQIVTHRGLNVSKEGLRVFVHRNKEKGRLELTRDRSGSPRWKVANATKAAAFRLGHLVED